jgi:hypothetical protein
VLGPQAAAEQGAPYDRLVERTPGEPELITAETAVWEALRTADRERDRALLAPDFLGVYPTGFVTRDDHVAELERGPIVFDYEILESRHVPAGPGSALLAYRVRFRPVEDAEPVTWMVTSLWRREPDGSLANTFSQDTPAAS